MSDGIMIKNTWELYKLGEGKSLCNYIKHKNIEAHRSILVERMFKNPKYDWQIRFIFTSFSLYHDLNGIPDGKSECTFW